MKKSKKLDIENNQNDEYEKDKEIMKKMIFGKLSNIEDKVQNLIVIFDSPKMFRLPGIFKSLTVDKQKQLNSQLEEVSVSLYHIGKHITKDIEVSISSIGIKDTSFLVKTSVKSYDEITTFKENQFLVKKSFQFFVLSFH